MNGWKKQKDCIGATNDKKKDHIGQYGDPDITTLVKVEKSLINIKTE